MLSHGSVQPANLLLAMIFALHQKLTSIDIIIKVFSHPSLHTFELLEISQALAQQYSSELLQSELERTRINTACFVESIPLDSVPESAKAAYASFRGSMDSPGRDFRGSPNIGPASFSKHRRR